MTAGYAVMDVMRMHQADKVEFGVWNKRPLIMSKAEEMFTSFLTNGPQYLLPENFMDVVVDDNAIEWDTLTTDMHAGEWLPSLALTDAGRQSVLKMAGGHHRVKALELWAIRVEEQMKVLKERQEFLLKVDTTKVRISPRKRRVFCAANMRFVALSILDNVVRHNCHAKDTSFPRP